VHTKKVTSRICLREAFFCHICCMSKRYSKNFETWEFDSKDGVPVPIEYVKNLKLLCKVLEIIRMLLGVAININSGYRSPAWNRQVGGSKDSFHMKGMAADLWTEKYSPAFIGRLLMLLSAMELIPKGGIHVYETFVHYDIRGYSARW